MKTNTILLCLGFVAACGPMNDGKGTDKDQKDSLCLNCRRDGDRNKLVMASAPSDIVGSYMGWHYDQDLGWQYGTITYQQEIGRIIALDEMNVPQVYVIIKRRDLKDSICDTGNAYVPQGVAYFDGANAGSTIKVEDCGDTTVKEDDWLIPKYDGTTLVHPGRKMYDRDPAYNGYLQFEAQNHVSSTNHTWYQIRNHTGTDTAGYPEDLLCFNNNANANDGWVMFIPGRIHQTNTSTGWHSDENYNWVPTVTTTAYTGYDKDKYNADQYMTAGWMWQEQAKVSLSCAYKTTDCLLGINGVSTATTPALLVQYPTPGDPDSDGDEALKQEDVDYAACLAN